MDTTNLISAARFIIRSPRTAGAAIACIALGTAAVSAVASLLSAALLRPLPFAEADRLVRVWVAEEAGGDRNGVALADVTELRELSSLERVEAATRARLTFLSETGGRRVEGEGVTAGYFDLVGARLAHGRFFTAAEHEAGSHVILLTHEAWGRLFAFGDSVVGAGIRTPEGVYTVVGVLAPAFTGTIEDDSGELEFFVPVALSGPAAASRLPGQAWAIGRLVPGATMAQARAEAAALGTRIAANHSQERTGTSLRVEAMSENWRADLRPGLWLLLGAATLLLLVAATNVGGLMLAHGLSRRREFAVRTALGASRRRTLGLLALEALAAAAAGGVVGLLLGPLLLRLFARLATVPVPAYITLEADALAMAASIGILGATSVVAALVPALATSGVEPQEVLRAGGRGAGGPRSEGRVGRALIVFQVALATVLVTSTALLLRSYHSLNAAELGFRTEGMLRVALFVNAEDARSMSDVAALQDRALEAVAAVPGVTAVGRIWPTAPLLAAPVTAIRYAGMDERRSDSGENVSIFAADPSLLDVLEIPLVAGRGITRGDHADSEPVAIISESLAERLDGPEQALGAVISAMGVDRRVVGVVADAHLTGPRAPAYEAPTLFLPLAQFPNRTVSFAIRASRPDAAAVLPAVRRALASVGPSSALDWTDTYDAALGEMFERDRFLVALTGVFSFATLTLAALGLFALLVHSVGRTRFEIGVRRALGATSGRIVGRVVGRSLTLVGTGLLLGFGLSVAATRLLAGLLYGVHTLDPFAFAATAAVLLAGGLLASAGPARSAARIPPATVLRGD